jgi:ribonuclease HI
MRNFNGEDEEPTNLLPCVQESDWDVACARLNGDGGSGPCGEKPRELKNLPRSAKTLICSALQCSLRNGTCPAILKREDKICIAKCGQDRSQICKRRPIGLTDALSKCCERIVLYKLGEHADCLEDPLQLAHRPGVSAEHGCAAASEFIATGLDDGEFVLAFQADFSGAFDRLLPCQALSETLADVDDPRAARCIQWLADFCTDRRVRGKCNGAVSADWKSYDTGIPQGTIAGPVVFKLLTKSLLRALHAAEPNALVQMYSDDLLVAKKFTSLAEAAGWASGTVKLVRDWAAEHNMLLDGKKSTLQVFDRKDHGAIRAQLRPLVHAAGCSLPFVNVSRYLGIWFDSGFTWKEQVTRVVSRARRRLAALWKLGSAWFAPRSAHLRIFYLSLVESVLTFSAAAYAPFLSKAQFDELDQVVRSGAAAVLRVARHNRDVVLATETGFAFSREIAIRESLRTYTTALSFEPDSPLRKAVAENGARCGWVRAGRTALADLGLHDGVITQAVQRPHVDHRFLELLNSQQITLVRNDCSHSVEAMRCDFDHEYYTDGANKIGSKHRSGAGFCKRLSNGSFRGDLFTLGEARDSYTGEQAALLMAVRDADRCATSGERVVLYTDALSVIEALGSFAQYGGKPRNCLLRTALADLASTRHVSVVFVRGHIGVEGNELADALAKRASKLPEADSNNVGGYNAHEVIRLHDRAVAKARKECMLQNAMGSQSCRAMADLWNQHDEAPKGMIGARTRKYMSNPMVFGEDDGFQKEDEIFYNLLRLDTSELGNRMFPHLPLPEVFGERKKCPHCHEPLTAEHVLSRCYSGELRSVKKQFLHDEPEEALWMCRRIRSELGVFPRK